jgi:hypothetical protein
MSCLTSAIALCRDGERLLTERLRTIPTKQVLHLPRDKWILSSDCPGGPYGTTRGWRPEAASFTRVELQSSSRPGVIFRVSCALRSQDNASLSISGLQLRGIRSTSGTPHAFGTAFDCDHHAPLSSLRYNLRRSFRNSLLYANPA